MEGAGAAVTAAVKKALTLPNPKYRAAVRYGRWVGKSFPRKLYFYKEEQGGLVVPRGYARQVVALCGKRGVEVEIVDERRSLPEVALRFNGRLRPYQEKAVADVMSRDFGVLEAGTGSGKTVMALAAIARRRQPAIVIVHTKELLYQWAERVREFLGVEAALIGDGRFGVGPVSVAIVNSARKRLQELARRFGHIVVDECHRVPASLFTEVVTAFDAKYSLGLSATAYRREEILTKLIYFYMGNCVHRVDVKELEASGAVVRPRIELHPTGFTYRYRDDYQAMLKALCGDEARNAQVADDVAAAAAADAHGVLLVVSDRVAHCERLAELIGARGARVALLTGQTPSEQRGVIVDAIRRGEIQVLVATVQLIGEGFDAAGLSALFLTTPIKFSGRLKQVVGRIMRPSHGKRAVVHDYVDERVSILKHSAARRREVYETM